MLFILVVAEKWGNSKINQKEIPKQFQKTWWQTSGRTQSIKKLRKIIKSRVWGHPGGSRGRLGDQLGPRAAQGSKRAAKNCETLVRFWHQNGTRSNFSWFIFVFFEVLALQVFHGFGCPRTSCWLPFWLYFESLGPLGKQLKVL